jgi:hypothetical protein
LSEGEQPIFRDVRESGHWRATQVRFVPEADISRTGRGAFLYRNSVFIGKLKDPAALLSRCPHYRSRL